MLLGPTHLFESNEGIMFCISDLLVGLRKRSFDVCFLGNQRNVCARD